MSVKYKIYGLTEEEAKVGINIATHLKRHYEYVCAYNASYDGIQRGNYLERMNNHLVMLEKLVKMINPQIAIREK